MTVKTGDLQEIKEEYVEYIITTMSNEELLALARNQVNNEIESLDSKQFKKYTFDNCDEYIYEDLKAYVEEEDPSKAYQLMLEIIDDRELGL